MTNQNASDNTASDKAWDDLTARELVLLRKPTGLTTEQLSMWEKLCSEARDAFSPAMVATALAYLRARCSKPRLAEIQAKIADFCTAEHTTDSD